MPNVGIKVPGILAPGTVNGTQVDLLPYFNGGLASSNRGGKTGVSVNFRKQHLESSSTPFSCSQGLKEPCLKTYTHGVSYSDRTSLTVIIVVDGGAVEPLMKNMPANDNSSNQ